MEKLNFNTNLNSLKIKSDIKDEVKKILDKKITFEKFTSFEKILYSRIFLYISWILVIFLVGIFFLILRNFKWNKRSKKALQKLLPSELYKIVLEQIFSNVKVNRGKEIPHATIKKYRGKSIPKDAWVEKSHIGPSITFNNMNFYTMWVRWHWKRRTDKSQSDIFYNKIYFYAPIISPKYFGTNLKFKKSHLFSHKGHDLENDSFNKIFWYKCNKPVKLRQIFTPYTQEMWVKLQKNKNRFNSLKGFSLDIHDKSFIMGKKENFNSEYGLIKTKPFNNKKDFTNAAYKNFILDLKQVLIYLRIISINKYFFSNYKKDPDKEKIDSK